MTYVMLCYVIFVYLLIFVKKVTLSFSCRFITFVPTQNTQNREGRFTMSDQPVTINLRKFTFTPNNKVNTLTITNVVAETVAFKLNTSTPDGYAVKPTRGFISPNSSEDILITYRPRTEVSDRDRFELEVRRLSPEEQGAVRVQDDPAAVARALNVAEPVPRLATHLWSKWKGKNPQETTRFRLESEYQDQRDGAQSTPVHQQVRSVEPQTAQSTLQDADAAMSAKRRNQDLTSEVKKLQEAEAGLQRSAQVREATSEEITCKNAAPGATLPPLVFLLLWLLFFYIGLTFDKQRHFGAFISSS